MIAPSSASTVRCGSQSGHPQQRRSRRLRIARALNITEAAADKMIYGRRAVNRECARVIAADLEAGDTEAATLFLQPIDAVCAPRHNLGLFEALHRAEMADCMEQPTDESFREKLRQGKATIEDAREYLRKSTLARSAAEEAEREVLAWIEAEEAKR